VLQQAFFCFSFTSTKSHKTKTMDWNQNPYMAYPGITPEEYAFLQQGTTEMTDAQKQRFVMIYSSKRRNPQDLMLCTLLGFIWISGVQRFLVGQIGMGLLYFFTGGLCFIGTIVDLVNYKSLADEYNRKMAYESFQIVKMGF
jgi:TM2 domain-containing membrane protein YozV